MAVILIGATLAWAGKGPVVHHVKAGGPDACAGLGSKPGCDKNYSLVAQEWSDGTVAGQYTDRFAGGGGFHATVDCLSVSGNNAWVGGVITSGGTKDFDPTGLRVITRVEDNGTSANDPPDRISFSFLAPAGDIQFCKTQPNLPLFDSPQGQVTVR